MHFSVLPNWAAPVSTGHPFGLPETGLRGRNTGRVPAVSKQSSSDTGFLQERSPTQYWRASGGPAEPANHCPPPSILQLKISALLDEQGEAHLDRGGETDAGGNAPDDLFVTSQTHRDKAADPFTGFDRLAQIDGCATRRLEKILD